MKVYIVTDLEGVGGVVSKSQVFADEPGYQKACEWLTLEVGAAVDGAIEGGATEVVVLDAHGANGARNMIYEKMHERAQYIQGVPRPGYLTGLDESFNCMFHIGAHAMSGTPEAVLEHTMSSLAWVQARLNGKPAGEIELVAAAAGHFNVPFVMISGDDKACKEAKELVPDVECAVVKEAYGRHSAKLLPIPVVHNIIREKAKAAMQKVKAIKPVKVDSPVELYIEYFRTDHVEGIQERQGVKKIGPREVVLSGDNILEAIRRMMGG